MEEQHHGGMPNSINKQTKSVRLLTPEGARKFGFPKSYVGTPYPHNVGLDGLPEQVNTATSPDEDYNNIMPMEQQTFTSPARQFGNPIYNTPMSSSEDPSSVSRKTEFLSPPSCHSLSFNGQTSQQPTPDFSFGLSSGQHNIENSTPRFPHAPQQSLPKPNRESDPVVIITASPHPQGLQKFNTKCVLETHKATARQKKQLGADLILTEVRRSPRLNKSANQFQKVDLTRQQVVYNPNKFLLPKNVAGSKSEGSNVHNVQNVEGMNAHNVQNAGYQDQKFQFSPSQYIPSGDQRMEGSQQEAEDIDRGNNFNQQLQFYDENDDAMDEDENYEQVSTGDENWNGKLVQNFQWEGSGGNAEKKNFKIQVTESQHNSCSSGPYGKTGSYFSCQSPSKNSFFDFSKQGNNYSKQVNIQVQDGTNCDKIYQGTENFATLQETGSLREENIKNNNIYNNNGTNIADNEFFGLQSNNGLVQEENFESLHELINNNNNNNNKNDVEQNPGCGNDNDNFDSVQQPGVYFEQEKIQNNLNSHSQDPLSTNNFVSFQQTGLQNEQQNYDNSNKTIYDQFQLTGLQNEQQKNGVKDAINSHNFGQFQQTGLQNEQQSQKIDENNNSDIYDQFQQTGLQNEQQSYDIDNNKNENNNSNIYNQFQQTGLQNEQKHYDNNNQISSNFSKEIYKELDNNQVSENIQNVSNVDQNNQNYFFGTQEKTMVQNMEQTQSLQQPGPQNELVNSFNYKLDVPVKQLENELQQKMQLDQDQENRFCQTAFVDRSKVSIENNQEKDTRQFCKSAYVDRSQKFAENCKDSCFGVFEQKKILQGSQEEDMFAENYDFGNRQEVTEKQSFNSFENVRKSQDDAKRVSFGITSVAEVNKNRFSSKKSEKTEQGKPRWKF